MIKEINGQFKSDEIDYLINYIKNIYFFLLKRVKMICHEHVFPS